MKLELLGGIHMPGRDFSRQKVLLLLGYLLLEGRRPRREVADLFYGHTKDPSDGLSTALRQLRTLGPDLIDFDGDVLASAVPCDVTDVLEALARKEYKQAVSAYGGPFALGYRFHLAIELEEWVFRTREQIATPVREAQFRLATIHLHQGNPELARLHLESGVAMNEALDPVPAQIRELWRLARKLRSGARSVIDAWVREYEIDTTTIDPSVEVASEQISRRHVALPENRTAFFGRTAERTHLLRLLQSDRQRIVTLVGLGGIGKSRLASEVLRDALDRDLPIAADGAAFVSLESVEGPEALARAVTRAISGGTDPVSDLHDLAHVIGNRSLLLVLDNFEHLLTEAPELGRLLDACPSLTVLVTSRRALDIAGEQLLPLAGLDPENAADLFINRVRARRPTFHLSGHELEGIEALCAELGGHPLGIELAANLGRILSAKEIIQEIRCATDILESDRRDAPDRHRSLRATFRPTWENLEQADRSLLTKLAVLHGSFDRETAKRVADGRILPLTRLVDRALVSIDENTRLRLHPLLRRFISEIARTDRRLTSELSHASTVHREFFAERVRTFAHATRTATLDDPGDLELDLPNILAALGAALEGGDDAIAVRIAHDLIVECNYLSAHGRQPGILSLLPEAIAAAKRISDSRSGHFLATKLGNAIREFDGDLVRAKRAYQDALDLAHEAHLSGREAILTAIVAVLDQEHAGIDADARLTSALELAELSENADAICHVLQAWSYVATLRRDWSEVRRLCERIVEFIGDEALAGMDLASDQNLFYALLNLAEALRELGSHDRSVKASEWAIEIARTRHQKLWEACALEELTKTLIGSGDRRNAVLHGTAALDLYGAIGAHRYRTAFKDFLSESDMSLSDTDLEEKGATTG